MPFPVPRLRAALFPAAAVLIGLAVTFQRLLIQPGTHLPGSPDQAALALWHLWWPASGAGAGESLAVHAYLGAPFAANHLLALPILPAGVYRLLALAGSPALAFNLTLIAAPALTALLTGGWLRRRGAPPLLAALAGLALILTPWYTAAVRRPDVIAASLWPLPLALLAWDAWLARPSLPRAALTAGAAYAGALCGVQHLSWLIALGLPYAIWTWQERPPIDESAGSARRDGLRLIGLLLAGLLLIYPIPAVVRAWAGIDPAYAVDLPARFAAQRSLIGEWRRLLPIPLLAAFSLLLARPGRRAAFWLAAGGGLLIFAAGVLPEPVRLLAGALDLPYQPLYPSQWLYGPAAFALIAAAAEGWGPAWARLPDGASAGAGAAALIGLIAAGLPALRPIDLHRIPVEPFYAQIAAEPEDYLLLEYPFGVWSDQEGIALGEGVYLARYAAWHGKRVIGGPLPGPAPALEFYRQMAFLPAANLSADGITAAAPALARAVTTWRIGYVIAHRDALPEPALAAITDLAEASGALCPPVERGGLRVFRARWHPAGCEAR